MARVDQGSSSIQQQPGAKLVSDGYGLLTATVVWKGPPATLLSSVCNRGGTCPLDSNLKSHKYTLSYDALGLGVATVDYVGIDASYYSGTRTEPQVGGSQGLSSEHISTHPNFFALATGFTGSPIAGVGSGTTTTPNFPVVTEGGITEYYGNNGSRFSAPEGNKFLGFKKAQYAGFYGKTNYLAPQTSFSGHFYTTSTTNITNLRDRVGKTSGSNQFASIPLVPSYVGAVFEIGTAPNTKNQLLLAQLSFEDFGSLYKVTYEVRYNREGYEPAVYATA
jgi:hypothetical protein